MQLMSDHHIANSDGQVTDFFFFLEIFYMSHQTQKNIFTTKQMGPKFLSIESQWFYKILTVQLLNTNIVEF